jgi:NhaP-type Na+/H+ or K+/H+ antiporter
MGWLARRRIGSPCVSLDPSIHQNLFVSITYYVVVFSVVVQGLTIGKFMSMQKKVVK